LHGPINFAACAWGYLLFGLIQYISHSVAATCCYGDRVSESNVRRALNISRLNLATPNFSLLDEKATEIECALCFSDLFFIFQNKTLLEWRLCCYFYYRDDILFVARQREVARRRLTIHPMCMALKCQLLQIYGVSNYRAINTRCCHRRGRVIIRALNETQK
jgi:hypothetical protein